MPPRPSLDDRMINRKCTAQRVSSCGLSRYRGWVLLARCGMECMVCFSVWDGTVNGTPLTAAMPDWALVRSGTLRVLEL
jgi:hypothetical protein